jgi:hypothetical protein
VEGASAKTSSTPGAPLPVESDISRIVREVTVVLYGMISLLGAKIWKENRVNFANPINLVPLAAGIIIAIGDVALKFSSTFSLSGIALGTIVAVVGWHVARVLAPADMRTALRSEAGYYGGTAPVIDEFGAHGASETGADYESPDPSSVDQVGRPGVPGSHTPGEGTRNR